MQSATVVVELREPYASSIKTQLPTRCGRIRPVARHSGERASLAPGWWRQPAFEVRELQEVMMPLWGHCLELPLLSTCAAGAAVLMATLADQTSLPWPDEFPRKIEHERKSRGKRIAYGESSDTQEGAYTAARQALAKERERRSER
jgi:hypothetical protein